VAPSVHELLAQVRPRERAPADRPFVYVNMIESLDGRSAIDGRSAGLGDDADLEMLLELRAVADAVLIGPGTVRAEGYARLVGSEERRAYRESLELPPDPVAVILSRSLDVPWDAGLFADEAQPVLVYTASEDEPPETAAPVEVVRLDEPTPSSMLADLRGRGVAALLSEGGPTLLSGLLEADVVDELFLTIAPLITGDPLALRIVEGEGLRSARRARPVWVLRAQGELFLRYALQ
jgi:riboflavin-specific deaminase-like protein